MTRGHRGKKEHIHREQPKAEPQKKEGDLVASKMASKWVIPLLIAAGVVWFGFYAGHTKEIPGSDDREYASIGRNIVEGKGIVRNFIYPVEINFFDKVPVPEFVHPPGYPLILAGFFKLFGISDFSALLPSYLSYFVLMLLFIFFAKKYLEFKTAVVATVILIFNKEILDLSLVALSELAYTVIFFLFFIFMFKARSLREIFISGILLGLSHSIRENIYPYLLSLFVYLYFYPDLPRWRKILFFIIGLSIPNLFNIIRSYLETGSPFFSYAKFALMTYTDKYPWMDIYRHVQDPSFEIGQFIRKYLGNLVSAWEGILSVSNTYLLALFFVEMFYWNTGTQWKRAKIFILLIMVSQIFFAPLITFNSRYFIPFLPMIVLFGSQSFLRISGNISSGATAYWKRSISLLIILLFFIFFMMPSTYVILRRSGTSALGLKTPQFGFLVPRGEARKLNDFLNGELRENQVVWTDLPEILEWEGNRLCGWLPTHIQSIYEIQKKIPVDAILLTNLRTPTQMGQEWKYLLFTEQSLPQFRNVKLYKGGMLFAKLLIRDGRD
jgi:4-amino-4-deoxy-L-arabinose transferase-like glycosyltransferase